MRFQTVTALNRSVVRGLGLPELLFGGFDIPLASCQVPQQLARALQLLRGRVQPGFGWIERPPRT